MCLNLRVAFCAVGKKFKVAAITRDHSCDLLREKQIIQSYCSDPRYGTHPELTYHINSFKIRKFYKLSINKIS